MSQLDNIVQQFTEMEANPARWDSVKVALDEFQSYLSGKVPVLQVQNMRESAWRNGAEPHQGLSPCDQGLRGVYLLFDERGMLLYVGVTRDSCLARLRNHDRRFDSHYVDVIPFKEEAIFLAYALESFLIERLRPLINERGL